MEKNRSSEAGSVYIYVDNADNLARLTQALSGTSRVGLDTEADSLHHYFEKVCLIQLSFLGTQYIVDPLAGLSLESFFEVLSQKELILQGADYDLRMLKKTFEFRPKVPVFDTMLAAQVLGYEKIGLGALVERACGIVLTQEGQKSDWSKRPLSTGQLLYASDDTKYLEAIADAQARDLRELRREDWHRECCARVVEITGLPGRSDAKEAWRMKGTSAMAPKTLAFVRELWKWRDEEARQRDRPPFMILRNEDLLDLVAWCAEHPKEPLDRGPRFLKRMVGDKLARLESAIRNAEGLSPAEWPGPPTRIRMTGERPSEKKIDELLAACKAIAVGMKIDPGFLASRAVVTSVVRHHPRSIEKVMEVSGLLRWQAEAVMPAIQTVLH